MSGFIFYTPYMGDGGRAESKPASDKNLRSVTFSRDSNRAGDLLFLGKAACKTKMAINSPLCPTGMAWHEIIL